MAEKHSWDAEEEETERYEEEDVSQEDEGEEEKVSVSEETLDPGIVHRNPALYEKYVSKLGGQYSLRYLSMVEDYYKEKRTLPPILFVEGPKIEIKFKSDGSMVPVSIAHVKHDQHSNKGSHLKTGQYVDLEAPVSSSDKKGFTIVHPFVVEIFNEKCTPFVWPASFYKLFFIHEQTKKFIVHENLAYVVKTEAWPELLTQEHTEELTYFSKTGLSMALKSAEEKAQKMPRSLVSEREKEDFLKRPHKPYPTNFSWLNEIEEWVVGQQLFMGFMAYDGGLQHMQDSFFSVVAKGGFFNVFDDVKHVEIKEKLKKEEALEEIAKLKSMLKIWVDGIKLPSQNAKSALIDD